MTTLLDDCQSLRTRLLSELPDGRARGDATDALDLVVANIRLVAIDAEKADASTKAGVDIDTLPPQVKSAWVGVVRAEKAAADDARRAAEAAAAEAERVRLAEVAAAEAEATRVAAVTLDLK